MIEADGFSRPHLRAKLEGRSFSGTAKKLFDYSIFPIMFSN